MSTVELETLAKNMIDSLEFKIPLFGGRLILT